MTVDDPGQLLAGVRDLRAADHVAAAGVLGFAARWADLHPAESLAAAATLTYRGEDFGIPIAGVGAPLVEVTCVAEFATAHQHRGRPAADRPRPRAPSPPASTVGAGPRRPGRRLAGLPSRRADAAPHPIGRRLRGRPGRRGHRTDRTCPARQADHRHRGRVHAGRSRASPPGLVRPSAFHDRPPHRPRRPVRTVLGVRRARPGRRAGPGRRDLRPGEHWPSWAAPTARTCGAPMPPATSPATSPPSNSRRPPPRRVRSRTDHRITLSRRLVGLGSRSCCICT